MSAVLPDRAKCQDRAARAAEPKRCLRRFCGDDHGAVTIEFVTMVPMFVALLMFFTDCSILYLTHSDMFNTARDIARRMSTGEITTVAQARNFALANLHLGDRVYVLATDPVLADLTVTISVPMRDAAVFGGFLAPVLGRNMTVSTTMRREPLM